MTIAQQIAHSFLDDIEKMITANKLDVGVLDTKVSYQSKYKQIKKRNAGKRIRKLLP